MPPTTLDAGAVASGASSITIDANHHHHLPQTQPNDIDREKQTSIPEANTYRGSGTPTDPYIVDFRPHDPLNPRNFPAARKWLYFAVATAAVLAVTMTSAAYAGSARELTAHFRLDQETYAAGVALYVLGFAIGPGLWAPLGELYGRRIWFVVTLAGAAAFTAASAGAPNITSLLLFRLITGIFAASPLTNSGGVIADLFPASQRGLPMSVFSAAPFLGPTLGPLVGGFISESLGWRWVQGVMAIFVGATWVAGCLFLGETFAPVILADKAAKLSRHTGEVYKSLVEVDNGAKSASTVFTTALKRPWLLLFVEPIIFIGAAYLSILYGTMYMFLGAFPIVYQELRGWSEGIGGLSFLGLGVGMVCGIAYMIFEDRWYQNNLEKVTPESRIRPACVGAVALPIGMFGFAWTTYPSLHWSASIILSSLFGFGMVLVFISVLNYIIDAYDIYAASALAATAMVRAFFGAAFPLFTSKMYHGLGVHWASSIPAFLTLACLPFPFLILKFGPQIRMKCKYAKETALLMARLEESL